MRKKPSARRVLGRISTMHEIGQFYQAAESSAVSHLALGWKGRTRYAVPLDRGAQWACWRLFQPGRMELPLRAMAGLPRLFGAVRCVESEQLALIRQSIGCGAGASCCRTGTPGPWTKDTILLLDRLHVPLLIVKAGKGEAVDRLLRNEAEWLRRLRDEPQLTGQLSELVAHRAGADLSFVAQTVLPGLTAFDFGEPHIAFLKKFQEATRRSLRYEESRLYRNLRARMKDLDGLLMEAWRLRLEKAMRRIEEQLSGGAIQMTAAHIDFTPWNIRLQDGVARVFDWEWADEEQLPLFDPLHFALLPMALKRQAPDRMLEKTRQVLADCPSWLGQQECRAAETQALAYLTNLCTLYLWSQRGRSDADPVLESYARLIDCVLKVNE